MMMHPGIHKHVVKPKYKLTNKVNKKKRRSLAKYIFICSQAFGYQSAAFDGCICFYLLYTHPSKGADW